MYIIYAVYNIHVYIVTLIYRVLHMNSHRWVRIPRDDQFRRSTQAHGSL